MSNANEGGKGGRRAKVDGWKGGKKPLIVGTTWTFSRKVMTLPFPKLLVGKVPKLKGSYDPERTRRVCWGPMNREGDRAQAAELSRLQHERNSVFCKAEKPTEKRSVRRGRRRIDLHRERSRVSGLSISSEPWHDSERKRFSISKKASGLCPLSNGTMD